MTPLTTAIPVGTLPRHWERALGYCPPTPRRWLFLYAAPYSDEVMYTDGVYTAVCNFLPFLEVTERSALVVPLLTIVRDRLHRRWLSDLIGTSSHLGSHGLLCDLAARHLYLVELEEAHAAFAPALPTCELGLTPEQQVAYWHAVHVHYSATLAATSVRGCRHCLGRQGYRLALDGGYDPCLTCQARSAITERATPPCTHTPHG